MIEIAGALGEIRTPDPQIRSLDARVVVWQLASWRKDVRFLSSPFRRHYVGH
jgi:hypothetical protein